MKAVARRHDAVSDALLVSALANLPGVFLTLAPSTSTPASFAVFLAGGLLALGFVALALRRACSVWRARTRSWAARAALALACAAVVSCLIGVARFALAAH